MKNQILFCWLLCLLFGWNGSQALAQKPTTEADRKQVVQAQPIIVVIPFTKVNEDCRTILDSFLSMRVAVIKMQDAFNDEGFTVVDYVAVLNAKMVDKTFTALSPSGAKEALIEASGADLYVEIEANEQHSPGNNSVRLNLKCYDAFTGRTLASKSTYSPNMNTDKFDRLAEMCISRKENGKEVLVLKDFLASMQEKFTEIIENGRFIKVKVNLDANSQWTFEDEVGSDGDELKDVINDWMEANAFKNQWSDPRTTDKELEYLQIAIPLRDEKNKSYKPSKFGRELRKFIETLSPAENPSAKFDARDDARGGTIFITLK